MHKWRCVNALCFSLPPPAPHGIGSFHVTPSRPVALTQSFSTGGSFAPQGTSGNVITFLVATPQGSAVSIRWAEAPDAAEYPTVHSSAPMTGSSGLSCPRCCCGESQHLTRLWTQSPLSSLPSSPWGGHLGSPTAHQHRQHWDEHPAGTALSFAPSLSLNPTTDIKGVAAPVRPISRETEALSGGVMQPGSPSLARMKAGMWPTPLTTCLSCVPRVHVNVLTVKTKSHWSERFCLTVRSKSTRTGSDMFMASSPGT